MPAYTLTIHKFYPVLPGEEVDAAKADVALTHGATSVFIGGLDPARLAAFASLYVETQECMEALRSNPWNVKS